METSTLSLNFTKTKAGRGNRGEVYTRKEMVLPTSCLQKAYVLRNYGLYTLGNDFSYWQLSYKQHHISTVVIGTQ